MKFNNLTCKIASFMKGKRFGNEILSMLTISFNKCVILNSDKFIEIFYSVSLYSMFGAYNIIIQFCTIAEFERQFQFKQIGQLPPPDPFVRTAKSYPSKNPKNPGMYTTQRNVTKTHF